MEYHKPELEASDAIYIFACKQGSCNGQTRVMFEASEVPIVNSDEFYSETKAS